MQILRLQMITLSTMVDVTSLASVKATDLRAGAALVAFDGQGQTEIRILEFILRGYSDRLFEVHGGLEQILHR